MFIEFKNVPYEKKTLVCHIFETQGVKYLWLLFKFTIHLYVK